MPTDCHHEIWCTGVGSKSSNSNTWAWPPLIVFRHKKKQNEKLEVTLYLSMEKPWHEEVLLTDWLGHHHVEIHHNKLINLATPSCKRWLTSVESLELVTWSVLSVYAPGRTWCRQWTLIFYANSDRPLRSRILVMGVSSHVFSDNTMLLEISNEWGTLTELDNSIKTNFGNLQVWHGQKLMQKVLVIGPNLGSLSQQEVNPSIIIMR